MEQEAGPRAGRGVRSALIAQKLEEDIVAGTIAAGVRLDETSIAERFGVSRTPVREALMTLTSRALAERVPYKGVVVARISEARIHEMFEAMGEIEAVCGQMAAGRMTMIELAELQELHARMQGFVQAGGLAEYETANSGFHAMIYAACRNADLAEVAEGLRLKLAPFRRRQLWDMARAAQSHKEHDGIVEALVDRDSQRAGQRLRRHLLSAAQAFFARRS
jgi:DNA-binding GntR family transcriptional regulator